MRAELGASNVQSKIAYFAPRDPGYVLDVSGAAMLKSSRHQADAQKFLAFLVSKQGQEIIAHSISFEYPIASGCHHRRAGDAVRSAAAQPDHDSAARRRVDGDRAAAQGRAAVTGGAPGG